MNINKHDKVRILPNIDHINGYSVPSFHDTQHETFTAILIEEEESVWLDNGYSYPTASLEIIG